MTLVAAKWGRTLALLLWTVLELRASPPIPIHEDLSEKELHHIFGVKRKEHVGEYWIDKPFKSRHSPSEHNWYQIRFNNEDYRFTIQPRHDLIGKGFHSVIRQNGSSSLNMSFDEQHCIYRGVGVSHNNTFISLTGCGQNARGMILTQNGEHYFIHPAPERYQRPSTTHNDGDVHLATSAHIIHKRSTPIFHEMDQDPEAPIMMEKPCLFNQRDDPFPEDRSARFRLFRQRRVGRLPVTKVRGPLIIELAVFADDEMWKHFREIYGRKADQELQKFILAGVNNIDLLFSHRSIQPELKLKIVRYEVMKIAPPRLAKTSHRNGEVDLLLEGFCRHQHIVNPASDNDHRHWDHALLFSGYDLYRGGLKSVAGYAPVKGMCSGGRSCTINEGLDFGAVFVITHEMGHSLGMYHDGDNGCESRCCIMSPSVGTGKTAWSRCSIKEFTGFISQLGTGLRPQNCLLDGGGAGKVSAVLDHSLDDTPPGQLYTLNEQCRIFHGDCWRHELRQDQQLADVCKMVWCGSGEGIIRTTHPALEGTYCGTGKWCKEGVCTRRRGTVSITHGSWSEWNDHPGPSCGQGCSTCLIQDQTRIRRSIRLCDSPAPNNGGTECKGSAYRGLPCNGQKCTGPSPNEFASEACRKLRNDANTPDLKLSGKGFQYEQSPCKIWCHMEVNNFIRTIGNFPDGTPCGKRKFCVRGECLEMACNNKAIVSDKRKDCPRTESVTPVSRQANRISRRPGQWGGWGRWSLCSQSCGRGVRTRHRSCLTGKCVGARRQRELCHQSPCRSPANWAPWSLWSQCDVTCGNGRQRRTRVCEGDGSCNGASRQFRSCKKDSCPSATTVVAKSASLGWSTWQPWRICSVSCGGGIRVRRRICRSNVCTGRSSESRECGTHPCRSATVESFWGSWNSWTDCTSSCGGGTRVRRRKCIGLGSCFGSSVNYGHCNLQNCIGTRNSQSTTSSQWQSWSTWGVCSRSCGGGLRQRTRRCNRNGDNRSCFGNRARTQSCNTKPCSRFADSLQPLESGGVWSDWGTWRHCSCRTGRQQRYRRCFLHPPCRGIWVEERTCIAKRRRQSSSLSPKSRWSQWQSWSVCSRSCGRGVRVRRRYCVKKDCKGSFRQVRYCRNATPCFLL